MKVSINDSRQYKQLTLDNGLSVLIVRDTDSLQSAAAMTVNVGHFDDPFSREGMAHFLEHMLFLGTESYPESGYFPRFVSQGGGNSNAWTGTEHSSFFFDVQSSYLKDALVQFAELFTHPLILQKDTENERKAIDAEFKMKVKDDSRRIYQVHKETINPKHPFSKFSVGNFDTLKDKSGSIATEIRAFFDTHYQAHWMTLVVCSPFPLEEVANHVKKHFSAIKSHSKPKPEVTEPLYRPEDLQQLLHIEPRKPMQKLIVSFPLTANKLGYKRKLTNFLAHLLGYEGEGSLYSILKSQGWINALSAGGGVQGSNFRDFNISIALTDEGIEYYDDIVEMVFEYLALIRQNQEALPPLYNDKRKLLDIAFDNQEPGRLLDWVCGLSNNMHHFLPVDYIYGDYIMEGFEPDAFSNLLKSFTPWNMRLVLIHPGVEVTKKAKWYKTPYQIEALDSAWLEVLSAIEKPLEQMALPTTNPYLNDDNPLLTLETKHRTPKLTHQQSGFKFWFKQDGKFRVAKGHFYLEIDSLVAVKSEQHIAMTRLLADLFMDSVAEQFYPAELAGLNYHLTSHQGGLTLQTSGLSASQLRLIEELVSALLTMPICPKRFAEYKKQLLRHWQAHNQNKPVGELFSLLGARLMPWNPTPSTLADALKRTSYHDFVSFRESFFNAVHLTAFLHGNWQIKHAEELTSRLKHFFCESEILKCLSRPLNVLNADERIKASHPMGDAGFVRYYQANSLNVKEKVSFMCLNQLINQDYFESLRTQQQLGYLVGSGYAPFNTRAGVVFYIQSPNFSADELVQAHNKFILEFREKLQHMDNHVWEEHKQSLRAIVAEKDKNLRLRSQRFWLAISHGHAFEMQNRLVSALESLERAEMIEFLNQTLENQGPCITLTC
ncbi:Protease III precursor [Pseudoalteromonas luteoviolacea B = ATCC 29581]|nr:Protease III precursor [Pseudoalteromonas luteoviolacea B = ATCC 29581]